LAVTLIVKLHAAITVSNSAIGPDPPPYGSVPDQLAAAAARFEIVQNFRFGFRDRACMVNFLEVSNF
jgi:hypothetical protein